MNGKKAKELRRIAHNLYETASPEKKEKYTKRQVYQMVKKQYKKGKKYGV